MAIIVARMASLGQAAYGEAAATVEQTIGSIKTVASFTGERRAVKKSEKSLVNASNASVRESLVSGVRLGTVMLFMFAGYSSGTWYGAKLILQKGYTGGKVISVIFAILTGSISLGQIAPCMKAFAAGQAAAFKMFETINRKLEIDAYDANGKELDDDIRGEIEFEYKEAYDGTGKF
ncbi:hypothetical protein C4D60_Mb01t26780 [Musa balbisiana]|uniref:ABC transmembrane type-1 domain-containing protein n=1 Tax=Musa balbisiana TaxID=52838 RepID=A0A4S8JQZ4_MUSBA|nr:hypothetical protein C4D60_Mb01t26780 [Musa balbisiana]